MVKGDSRSIRERLDRRKILQATGTGGAISIFGLAEGAGSVEARSSNHRGTVNLIEANHVIHRTDGAQFPSIITSHYDPIPDYSVNSKNELYFHPAADEEFIDQFSKNDTMIKYNGSYSTLPKTVNNKKTHRIAVALDGLLEHIEKISLRDRVEIKSINFSHYNSNRELEFKFNGNKRVVQPGAVKNIPSGKKSVSPSGRPEENGSNGSVDVELIMIIRNYGSLDLYEME